MMKDERKSDIIGEEHFPKHDFLLYSLNSAWILEGNLCFFADMLSSAPCSLDLNDVEDFCSLAIHYAVHTPHSFSTVSLKKSF